MANRDELRRPGREVIANLELRCREIEQLFDDYEPTEATWTAFRAKVLAVLAGAVAERDKLLEEVRDRSEN
jgi:hypothetical protein